MENYLNTDLSTTNAVIFHLVYVGEFWVLTKKPYQVLFQHAHRFFVQLSQQGRGIFPQMCIRNFLIPQKR
jgi:hypothetical protein